MLTQQGMQAASPFQGLGQTGYAPQMPPCSREGHDYSIELRTEELHQGKGDRHVRMVTKVMCRKCGGVIECG